MDADDGRAKRTEETRRAILKAAKTAFARHGYDGASVRDISKVAGTHPALVTYHFETKDKLYDAVMDGVMDTLRDRLFMAAASADNPSEVAWKVIEAYDDYLEEERDLPRIVMRALTDSDARVTRRLKAKLEPMFEHMRQLMLTFESPQRERLADAVVSIFAALVVPATYGPLLEAVYGAPLDSKEARQRRREHLKRLLAAMVRDVYGE